MHNAGVKDASDKKILVDMLFWAIDNPPPANYLLISGDRDFSNALHQLRMRRYNILLAQPPNVSQALVAAATSVWLWTSLLIGGPPLPEVPHLQNTLNGSKSTGDTPTSTMLDVDSNQKNHGNGKVDNRNKGKQSRKAQSQTNTNIPRTASSGSEGQQPNGSSGTTSPSTKNGKKQPNHASSSTISGSRAPEGVHMNNSRPNTPHIPPDSGRPNTPNVPPSAYDQPRPAIPANNENVFPNLHHTQYSQSPGPSGFQPHQPWNLSDSSSTYTTYPPSSKKHGPSYSMAPATGPTGQPFTSFPGRPSAPPFPPPPGVPQGPPFTSLPDMSRLNISEYPNGVHQNVPPFYHNNMHRSTPSPDSNTSGNGSWGTPGCPTPSNFVQGQIGFILRALHILKTEKMAPTEANIADCICYGEMNTQNFNVRKALDYAIEHQAVLVHKIGNNLPLYVGKTDTLWKCINIVDNNAKHAKTRFDAVLKFLSSDNGRNAILATQCRY